MNTSLVKLKLDLFNSDTVTSAHKVHVHVVFLYTTPSAVRLCNNIGLVSLILLGWELHVSCITVLCYKASQSCLLCFLCHPYIPIFTFTCQYKYSLATQVQLADEAWNWPKHTDVSCTLSAIHVITIYIIYCHGCSIYIPVRCNVSTPLLFTAKQSLGGNHP